MECRPSQKKDKADVKANPFTTFNIYGGELKPLSVTFSGNSSNSESYFERDPQTIAPPLNCSTQDETYFVIVGSNPASPTILKIQWGNSQVDKGD